ncbi:hypothetical protein M5K25_016464 [Dendrobium thyrsiflorum]|uniref:SBP-type domain-containing protein n=1 Tax=Dendrobium thyrsiflorum TaxID=117978 RepID=A0ABD0UJT0_DENTH
MTPYEGPTSHRCPLAPRHVLRSCITATLFQHSPSHSHCSYNTRYGTLLLSPSPPSRSLFFLLRRVFRLVMESGGGQARVGDGFGGFTAWGFCDPATGSIVVEAETAAAPSLSSYGIPAITIASTFGERGVVPSGNHQRATEGELYSYRQQQQQQYLTCLKLGKRQYCGRGAAELEESTATKRSTPTARALVPRCQVEGCNKALVDAKDYHKRHKVCEMHSKAPCVVVLGVEQRFCQQCSRFHIVSEFDDAKRSCRRRLAGHNERRRKSSIGNPSLAALGFPLSGDSKAIFFRSFEGILAGEISPTFWFFSGFDFYWCGSILFWVGMMATPSPNNPWFSPKDPSSRSFKDVLAGSSSEKKIEFMHATFKGTPALIFDDNVVTKLAAPFSFTLVGKFMFRRPSIDLIRKFFVNLKLSGSFSVGLMDARHIAIQLNNDLDYSRIFARRSYYILGCQMRLLKWTPEFDVQEESPIVPVWVCFPNLRLHFFNNQVLFALASFFGRPLQTDQATSNLSRPSVARVLVEVDVSKKYPKEIWIGSELNGYYQKVELENLPIFCSHCKMHGHIVAECYALHPNLRKTKQNVSSEGADPMPVSTEQPSDKEGGYVSREEDLQVNIPECSEQGMKEDQLTTNVIPNDFQETDRTKEDTNLDAHDSSKIINTEKLNVQVDREEEIREEGELITSPRTDMEELGNKNQVISGMNYSLCRQNIEELTNNDEGNSRVWKRLCDVKWKMEPHINWKLGRGNVSFWHDNWFNNGSIDQTLNTMSISNIKVNYFYSNYNWDESKLREYIPAGTVHDIMKVPFNLHKDDTLVCDLAYNDKFSVMKAWHSFRNRTTIHKCFTLFRHKNIPPTVSIFLWRIWNYYLPTDDILIKKGFQIVSKCQCCYHIENVAHIFINNPIAVKVWLFFEDLLKLNFYHANLSVRDLITKWFSKSKGHISHLICALILWNLWLARNNARFNAQHMNFNTMIEMIKDKIYRLYKIKVFGVCWLFIPVLALVLFGYGLVDTSSFGCFVPALVWAMSFVWNSYLLKLVSMHNSFLYQWLVWNDLIPDKFEFLILLSMLARFWFLAFAGRKMDYVYGGFSNEGLLQVLVYQLNVFLLAISDVDLTVTLISQFCVWVMDDFKVDLSKQILHLVRCYGNIWGSCWYHSEVSSNFNFNILTVAYWLYGIAKVGSTFSKIMVYLFFNVSSCRQVGKVAFRVFDELLEGYF